MSHRLTAKECGWDRRCETCGRMFRPIRQTMGRYCGMECAGVGRRVFNLLPLTQHGNELLRAVPNPAPDPVIIDGREYDVVVLESRYSGASTLTMTPARAPRRAGVWMT